MYKRKKMEYKAAKKVLDQILKDSWAKDAASALVEKGKKSPDFAAAFATMTAALAKFKKPGQRIAIVAPDGSYVHSDGDTETPETVKAVENHAGRNEFQTAKNHRFGAKVKDFDDEEKKRIPKALRKMMLKGYGVDSRRSSTTGKVESYVAKVFIRKGDDFPNSKNFMIRVSVSQ